MSRGARFGAVAMMVWLAVPAAAQDEGTPSEPSVEAWLSNLTRVETWRFFEPPLPAVDPDYTFFANRSDLQIQVRNRRVDLGGGFAYVRVQELPTDAIGPGGLGTGAFYFASSGLPYSYQVFLTGLTLSTHTADRRGALTFGRMAYTSGAEGERPPTAGSRLAAVRRLAIDGRLIGTFDWSYYQRRFDGARVEWNADRRYSGGGLFLVTQGGYEESANLTMSKLLVGTAYAGHLHRAGESSGGDIVAESQLFGALYRDRRAIDIRPDNAGIPVEAADITIGAVGASHVASREVRDGTLDFAVWGAGQLGGWYGQTHRAYAVAAQGGYRWTTAPARPWLRAGVSHASGDPRRSRRSARDVLPDAPGIAESRAIDGLCACEPPRRVPASCTPSPTRASACGATCTDWRSSRSPIAGTRAAARRPGKGRSSDTRLAVPAAGADSARSSKRPPTCACRRTGR